ncbi:hypothetical protein BDW60DRAFT_189706 [Aspergillus nidulans var. acristatus]
MQLALAAVFSLFAECATHRLRCPFCCLLPKILFASSLFNTLLIIFLPVIRRPLLPGPQSFAPFAGSSK